MGVYMYVCMLPCMMWAHDFGLACSNQIVAIEVGCFFEECFASALACCSSHPCGSKSLKPFTF